MAKDALEKAVERLKSGDMSAFDYIYEHTYKVVFFVVHNIVRSKETSEDLVQETYLKAFKHLDGYKTDSVLAWLTAIARNLALNSYKKGKRETPTDFEAEDYRFGAANMPDEDCFGLIKLAESSLSEEDFQIVVMCAVAGYKRREVSEILKMPVSTVTYKYLEALKTLRKKLEGDVNERL